LIIVQPEYNNDIAILTLNSPVKYTKKVKPVCLPPQGSTDQYEGELAIVKGWGATGEDGNSSQVLLHAEKAIISNSQCQKIHAEAKIGQNHHPDDVRLPTWQRLLPSKSMAFTFKRKLKSRMPKFGVYTIWPGG
jgi:hypothetical protein